MRETTEILKTIIAQGERIMMVGAMPTLDAHLRDSGCESIVSVAYSNLTATTIAQVRPDLVLAPLLGPGFDIVDIGVRLEAMGYNARLSAVTVPLPDAVAVAREIRNQFRNLEFALIELVGEPDLRANPTLIEASDRL